MQERCLNAYISGSIDEPTFEKKKFELKTEIEELEKQAAEEIEDPTAGKTALAVYNFSQKAHKIWLGSNFSIRRAILDCISSNRTLDNASLYVSKRSPFDILAERAFCSNGRDNCQPFEPQPTAIEPFLPTFMSPPEPYIHSVRELLSLCS